VGQGIAGSVLALGLISRGKSVLVIDQPELSLSSKAAAGIWNPVVFKRLTKSWLADEVLPELHTFYDQAEKMLSTHFLENRKMLKLFTEEQEKTFWEKKAAGEMQNYLDPEFIPTGAPFETEAGSVLQAGTINTLVFLNATRAFLSERNSFLGETFNYTALEQKDSAVFYKVYSAGSIIFCEGHLIKNNPFFSFVPMKPAKGEVLTIRCEELDIDYILNKNFFILPLGDHLFKAGATYNWQDMDDNTSEAGRKELEDKFKKLIPFPYEIVKQEAGVRPSVIDRRPVIGKHPGHPELLVFNGFGTKAVMLAPYFAKQFCEYLEGKSELDKEVDCRRFFKIEV
jgi:glycine/D-amino acid oxidase-like deaminating enzyme